MSTKRFIIKSLIKITIFLLISIVVLSILSAIAPVITNKVALGQMSNDDASYIMWETYNKIRPIVEAIYSVIVFIFIGSIGIDTYKFINTKMKENKE